MNAAAKILGHNHQDHDQQPCAERQGIGTDDVKQLPHERIMRTRKRTDGKAAGLNLGIYALALMAAYPSFNASLTSRSGQVSSAEITRTRL
jgi:hypothetical protein